VELVVEEVKLALVGGIVGHEGGSGVEQLATVGDEAGESGSRFVEPGVGVEQFELAGGMKQ
jgi:hypothetical protein